MERCLKCFKDERELVKLKCSHKYCLECIKIHLKANLKPKIKCPYSNCQTIIRDSIIRRVLCDEDIATYEKMCLQGIKKSHKCILKECPGYIMYTDENTQYECPSCTLYNCISCKDSHPTFSCSQFKQMSETDRKTTFQEEKARAQRVINVKKYSENRNLFLSFEDQDLLPNNIPFECHFCCTIICKGDGVKLRACSHLLCKSCLGKQITEANEIPVKCPQLLCNAIIMDIEIRSILSSEDFESYLLRYNESLKKNNPKYLQCQTPNCRSFYDYSTKPESFTCKNCEALNCVKCRAVHPKESCKQYQNKLKKDPNYIAMKNKRDKGEIMECPSCKTILQKTKGCNWIQCINCSLEICWILQIPRWGPKGRGDLSGGCKCGVDGKKCDPRCDSSCTPHMSDDEMFLFMLMILRDISPRN